MTGHSKLSREGDAIDVDLGILQDFSGHLLRLAWEAASDDFARRISKSGLKPRYLGLLTLILNNPGISQADLGVGVGKDKSSIAKYLRQMEDAGLILRERLERDRRNHACYATDNGREAYQVLEKHALEHKAKLDKIIGPERQELFLSALNDIIGMERYQD